MASHPPPPAFLRLAAHSLRWRLLTELALSDQRVRDLVALTAEPQNLVSYHLRLLREAGLVSTTRSTFDGRDTYYHLDLDHCAQAVTHAAATLHPALRSPAGPHPHTPDRPPAGLHPHAPGHPSGPHPHAPDHPPAGPHPFVPGHPPAGPHPHTPGQPSTGPHLRTPGHPPADPHFLTPGHPPADPHLPAPAQPPAGPGLVPRGAAPGQAGPQERFTGSGDSSQPRTRVLFVCTGNSARSPIAEALLRHRSGGRIEVASAGSQPRAAGLHPHAVRVLHDEYGIDVTGSRPRHWDTLADRRFDYVISLCDRAREACPDFPGKPRRAHWSLPAPTDYPGHLRTAAGIDTRIRHLLPLLEEVQP